jgi:hypothetical protein
MAVVITETKFLQYPSSDGEGRARLWFSVNNDTTTFTIAPGNSDSNQSGSSALRKIDTWKFENVSAEKAPKIVKSFNTTYGCDVLTFTCASGDDYVGWVEGQVQA